MQLNVSQLPVETQKQIEVLKWTIGEYVKQMGKSRRVDAKVGADQQRALWLCIKNVIGQNPSLFTPLFTILLEEFAKYKDECFNERLAFRFFEHVRLEPEEVRAFRSMLSLLIRTTSLKTRGLVVAQIDFNLLLRDLSETARQNLTLFYKS